MRPSRNSRTPCRLWAVAIRLPAVLLGVVLWAGPAQAASPFTVNSTGDTGDASAGDGFCNDGGGNCTLRAAIQEANAWPGTDTIDFQIPPAGAHTITLTAALPAITSVVNIDGTTQNGFAGAPLYAPVIEVSALACGANAALDLRVGSTGSTIRGLAITRCPTRAIRIFGTSSQKIYGNFLGTDVTGTATGVGNGVGVYISSGGVATTNNKIGSPTAGDRNVISGNTVDGIQVNGGAGGVSNTTIQNNYIGVDVNGTGILSNGATGVAVFGTNTNTLIGGTAANTGNVISGNVNLGIGISSAGTTGTLVQGNKIGTDAAGTTAIANSTGIQILTSASGSIIGGPAGSTNVISGNTNDGILISGGATTNTVSRSLIGTDVSGTAKIPNGGNGIQITGSSANTIGGTTAEGNVISGNDNNGIDVIGASTGNFILGNIIGLNAAGDAKLGNMFQGVAIAQASTGNTVGDGTGRNIISGNGQYGIRIVDAGTNNNTVQNNYIGLNLAGDAQLGNTSDGIIMDSGAGPATGNVIGAAGLGNVISGNGSAGIEVRRQISGTVIASNKIGTDAAGTGGIGNVSHGVYFASATAGHTVGGATSAERNVISSNGGQGVRIDGLNTTNIVVTRNYIGTDAAGTGALPNVSGGIAITNQAAGNTIGGTGSGAGNLIAFNATYGVIASAAAGTGNAILGNAIHSNTTELGIDLVHSPIGVTDNDLGDGDTGPNNIQNFPVLSGVTTNGSSVHIAGSLNSLASTTYRIEFFASALADPSGFGEGERYLDFANVTTDASGDAVIGVTLAKAVAAGEFVTATATELPANNTSEFSATYTAQGDLIVTTTADVVDGDTTDVPSLIANPGNPGDGRISLREAILATNANPGADTILFGIPLADTGHVYYKNNSVPSSLPAPIPTTWPDALITDFDSDYATGYARSWYRIQPNGSALPQVTESTVIDAGTQPGHQAGKPVVELEGSLAGAGADGLSFVAAPSAVKDFIIDGFTKDGLNLHNPGGYVVTGNHVGIDPSGTLATVGNGGNGVFLGELATGAATTIGGTSSAERNVISANVGHGVYVWAFGNPGIDSQVIIQGNYIGTDVTGSVGLGVQLRGITLEYARNHVIGGSGAGEGNVISGNAGYGVELNGDFSGFGTGANDNLIEGNFIGTDAAGTAALPNGDDGIIMFATNATSAASNNTVRGNVIAASSGVHHGIRLLGDADGNTIDGNFIGTDLGAMVDLGNTGHGIMIESSGSHFPTGNTVVNNTIRFNDLDGVAMTGTGSVATITQNAIYTNDGIGIDLDDDGATSNDLSANDSDPGANTLLNYPMIAYPMESGGTISLNYQIDTSPGWYRLEFFRNTTAPDFSEGESLAKTVMLNHTGGRQSYSTTFAGSAGDVITATATACDDGVCTTPASTSEFSWAKAALATAVELLSFEGTGSDGAVNLAWETGSELNNLGFHLYRGPSETGPWTRITESLIPGLGSSPLGARYSYRDAGLENGTAYHYLLEDVETTGRVERHGPVSATPAVGEDPGDDGNADNGDTGSRPRIAYGDPEANALRVVEQTASGVVLELVTQGFYATAQDDGTVVVEVPGFEELSDPGWPSLPVKRSWVDAVAGRQVDLGRVRASGVEGFAGLRPADATAPQLEVLEDGTIRAGQRRARRAYRKSEALYPEQAARLLEVGFQGERKRAFVELAPLRWDGETGQLLLARRLEVRVSFQGREPDEVSLGGSRGRRRPRGGDAGGREVVARLGTGEAGLYGVRFEAVFPGQQKGLRSTELRLSRQGEAVAYRLEPDPKRFGPGSVLYFVSAGRSANPWGTEAVYELEQGAGGVAMAEQSASPRGATQASLWRSGQWEETRYYLAALVEASEPWYWARVFDAQVFSTDFELPALSQTGEAGRLELWLQGGSDFEADPDHHVRVRVNGVPVSEASWDGRQALTVEATLAAGVLQEGSNRLEVENAGDTEAASSVVYVDRFAVSYPSRVEAQAGILQGRFTGSGRAEVQGLGAGAVLLETTDPGAPRWLTGAVVGPGGTSLRVEAGASYLAVDAGAVKTPKVRPASPVALRDAANAADYLVVGPRAFLAEAGPLLELRRQQGLVAMGVAIEDVFDAFGYGESRPQALVDFLRYAYHEWQAPTLRYVVLLGDASFDPRDLLGTGIANPVPSPMVRSSFMWTASDLAYAAVNGEDDLPDVALGRLSASTAEEARALVEKVVAWESGGFGLEGPAVLVADNSDPAGDFEGDARRVASTLLAGREVETIFLSEQGPAGTRASIRAAFDRGVSLVSYMGHGALSVWASENVFNRGDLASLQPQGRQPLVLTMNCLNGYFVPPATDSLGEMLVGTVGKGAIAAFSPSGLSIHGAAVQYHDALVAELVSGRHRRLGDAVLAAQLAYADTGELPELLRLYHLFGDPALTLR